MTASEMTASDEISFVTNRYELRTSISDGTSSRDRRADGTDCSGAEYMLVSDL